MIGVLAGLMGGLATVLATLAALAVLHPSAIVITSWAPVLHALAALMAVTAARLRAGGWRAELDAVLAVAIFVPLFGPALAWAFVSRVEDDTENAHARFERGEGRLRRGALPEDGEFEAKQVHPMSLGEILRYGSMDQKRNALSRLRSLGQPRHFRMLRRVMIQSSGELRLCAFVELDRAAAPFEEQINAAQGQLRDLGPSLDRGRAKLLTELATAHRNYGVAEILDPELGRYHLERAASVIEEAWRVGGMVPKIVRLRALCLSDQGQHAAALTCLDALPEAQQSKEENRIARAEIAFRKRDFGIARLQAERLRAAGLQPPEWLAALAPAPAEEVGT